MPYYRTIIIQLLLKQQMLNNNDALHHNNQANAQQNNGQQAKPPASKIIGSYVLGKTIGKGTFGKVKIATHIPTGQKVAIKILEKDRIVDVADVERVSRQIHILKLIRHPAIIQLYQIIQTPKHLFLVMEYIENGELFEYIVKKKKINQEEACKFFQQIIGGVEYLHQLNIVHRDLKPQNLLIAYDNTLRLVDFGLSNTYRNQQKLKTACGSPCYAAPQMIEAKNKYDPLMVDIWSCGVILYAMLCGCLPFEDSDTSKLYQKILCGEYKVPKHLSQNAKDFLSKILDVNPESRLKISDVRNHPFWKKALLEQSFTKGIIIGYHRIPVDMKILAEASLCGINADFTKKCIQANRHNSETTTYYLLLKKFVKNGGVSQACLGSKNFNPSLIRQKKIYKNPSESSQTINNTEQEAYGLIENRKKASFSFKFQKQRKNKTLEVRVRQTLYNNNSRNKANSINKSKDISKADMSISEFIRESPAMAIKKYHHQFHTLEAIEHQKSRNKSHEKDETNFYNKKNQDLSINYKPEAYPNYYPQISKRSMQGTHHNKFKFNQTIKAYNKGSFIDNNNKKYSKKVYPLGELGEMSFDDGKIKATYMGNFYQPIKMPHLRKIVFH